MPRFIVALSLAFLASLVPAADVYLGLGAAASGASPYTGGTVPATTRVPYSDGTALTSDAAFTRGSLAFSVDSATDNVLSTGNGKLGFVPGGTSGDFYIGHRSNFSTTAYGIRFLASGTMAINVPSGQTIYMGTNSNSYASVDATSLTLFGDYLTTSNATAGALTCNTAGGGVSIKSGTNARCGTATLVAGTVTVSNTSVTANTRIMLTVSTLGGTQGLLRTSKVAATSFTITSANAADTSTIDWLLVENP